MPGIAAAQWRMAAADVPTMLPMLPSFMEETQQIFGKDFWPYGLDANRNALEKLVLYVSDENTLVFFYILFSIQYIFKGWVRQIYR